MQAMPRGIPRDQSVQRNVLHRLKIARGHLEKVIDMVEKGEYCLDIVHQSRALQAALRKADEKLLENHLATCVVQSIRNGSADEVVDEMMEVIRKS